MHVPLPCGSFHMILQPLLSSGKGKGKIAQGGRGTAQGHWAKPVTFRCNLVRARALQDAFMGVGTLTQDIYRGGAFGLLSTGSTTLTNFAIPSLILFNGLTFYQNKYI